jgi:hypothetical protein
MAEGGDAYGLSLRCELDYWIKDDVWRAAAHAAKAPFYHLCLNCVAREIGRPVTLRDLEISIYLRTTQHNGMDFMRLYAQATVIGACRGANFPVPAEWIEPSTQPHLDAMKIGEQLAHQTREPAAVLPGLVADVDRCFPARSKP